MFSVDTRTLDNVDWAVTINFWSIVELFMHKDVVEDLPSERVAIRPTCNSKLTYPNNQSITNIHLINKYIFRKLISYELNKKN